LINIFVKHWRLVLLVLGIVLFLWILYALRIVVLPFAVGLVLAYLLMPLVWWLEKKLPPRNKWPGFRRVMSVLIAFILLLAVLVGFAYIVVTAVIDASILFIENAPYFIGQSMVRVQEWVTGMVENLPVEIQEEVSRELVQGGVDLGKMIRDGLMGAVSSIPGSYAILLGFAVLPFFLFYIMKDSELLRKGISSTMTPRMQVHARNIVKIIERVLGRYIRAQIMLGVIVAYFSFIGLLILDIDFALALAVLAGVMEMVPTLGPWISGAAAVIVALAMAPDKAIWVAVLYLAVQALENNLLVPKIQSAYLRIHPAVMIVLLVFGAYFAGFWGILLIGPLTATLVEVYKYIRDHMKAQQTATAAEATPTA
jgi:predicted PurR-regulated permease PerM